MNFLSKKFIFIKFRFQAKKTGTDGFHAPIGSRSLYVQL